MIYLETGSQDPYFNLAFEEFVLSTRTSGDYLLLWQNANTVVLGQNQNAEEEINRAFIEQHHIHVVRRSTGGGAVYHDLGNLNYSFISDAGTHCLDSLQRFMQPVVLALRGLGLDAAVSGRNDILIEGRKVSGTAQRLMKGRILHHGTLLFDSDPDMITGSLNADPEKFRSKSSKSVRKRIGNIRDFLKGDMDLPAFWKYLREALSGNGFVQGSLSDTELAAVESIADAKYRTWAWNFGDSPQYDLHNRCRFSSGTLEVALSVEHGIITDITFFGDFLSTVPLKDLSNALCGCHYREEDIGAVLNRFPLLNYFGGITREEVLDTILNIHSEPV